jgi:hypothetical protein
MLHEASACKTLIRGRLANMPAQKFIQSFRQFPRTKRLSYQKAASGADSRVNVFFFWFSRQKQYAGKGTQFGHCTCQFWTMQAAQSDVREQQIDRTVMPIAQKSRFFSGGCFKHAIAAGLEGSPQGIAYSDIPFSQQNRSGSGFVLDATIEIL